MGSLTALRRQLLAFFKTVATLEGKADLVAVPTLKAAGERSAELRALLDDDCFDFSDLRARIEGDPDLSSLIRQRRIDALVDYARLAIGLIDRELTARRGHMIVSANDD